MFPRCMRLEVRMLTRRPSLKVPRRHLVSALGLGGVAAALSGRAKADTAYTSFQYPIGGGSRNANRTTLSRFSGLTVDVRDFGAAGNGVNDDSNAIQAAVAAADTQSTGGIVFFPPGRYRITKTIMLPSAQDPTACITIRGTGRGSQIILDHGMKGFAFYRGSGTGPQQATFTGSISGDVLTVSGVSGTIAAGQLLTGTGVPIGTTMDWGSGSTWHVYPDPSSVSSTTMKTYASPLTSTLGGFYILDLNFVSQDSFSGNTRASGIYLQGAQHGTIQRCRFVGTFIGIWLDQSCFWISVRDCDFEGPGDPTLTKPPVVGSIGYMNGILYSSFQVNGGGQPVGCLVDSCNFVNHWTSMMVGSRIAMRNVRIEKSTWGVRFQNAGDPNDPSNGPYNLPVSFVIAEAFDIEACTQGIAGESTVANAIFRNIHLLSHSGDSGGVTGVPTNFGFFANNLSDVELITCSFGGHGFSPGYGVMPGGSAIWANVSFKNVQSDSWHLPAAGSGLRAGTFIDWRSNFGAWELNIIDLPGQGATDITTPVTGMEYNVANANTTTFGADVVAAGPGSKHVKVRYNSATGKWTCCGV